MHSQRHILQPPLFVRLDGGDGGIQFLAVLSGNAPVIQIANDFLQFFTDLSDFSPGVYNHFNRFVPEEQTGLLPAGVFKGVDVAVPSEGVIIADEDHKSLSQFLVINAGPENADING